MQLAAKIPGFWGDKTLALRSSPSIAQSHTIHPSAISRLIVTCLLKRASSYPDRPALCFVSRSSLTKKLPYPSHPHSDRDDIMKAVHPTHAPSPIHTPALQRALLLRAPRQRYELVHDHPLPTLDSPDEVLIRVDAIGLNPMQATSTPPDFLF